MLAALNPIWFVLGFVGCIAIFAVASILRQRQRPGASRTRLTFIWAIALLLIAFGLRGRDNHRMRNELRSISPAAVSKIVLGQGDRRIEIANAPEITNLLSRLQSVTAISGHHSHPTHAFDVLFEAGGRRFHYRVGRDSQRADEYCIMLPDGGSDEDSGLEIGRVRSADWAQWVTNVFSSNR